MDKRQIPPDFAKAFADAVLAFEFWESPERPGRMIPLRRGYYTLEEICVAVDQFNDQLPEEVFDKLRSYMHDYPHGALIAEIEVDRSYRIGAYCLRGLMEIRAHR